MERQLKFRAWDNKKKEWLMGYELPNLGGFSLFGECMLFEEWSHILDQFLFERNGYKHEDLKVMQYTNLKDKNGKDIYEGDILKQDIHTEFGSFLKAQVGQMVWHKHGMWAIKFEDASPMNFEGNCPPPEIIGNIYETPELLK